MLAFLPKRSVPPPSPEGRKSFGTIAEASRPEPMRNIVIDRHGRLDDHSDRPLTTSVPSETRRIMRKLDWRIMPACILLYLVAFLDRTAIGFTRIAGINEDLHLSQKQYQICLTIFFISYAMVEVPCVLIQSYIGAKVWLPLITVIWGLVTALTGTTRGFPGLLACRLFLGFAEAGLFAGINCFLPTLYPNRCLQTRLGIFVSAAFSGLLAYALTARDSQHAWRTIFYVDGGITCAFAFIAAALLCNGIEDARWLTGPEKQYLSDRVKYDEGSGIKTRNAFDAAQVLAGLTDWKTVLGSVPYFTTGVNAYSVALTLPTILTTALSYSTVESQIMSVPVWAAAALAILTLSVASDWTGGRIFYAIGTSLVSLAGWTLSMCTIETRPRLAYVAQFLAAIGGFATLPSLTAFYSQNFVHSVKRSTALAVIFTCGGALSGLVASNIFPVNAAPHYRTGHLVNIVMAAIDVLVCCIYAVCIALANRSKRRKVVSGVVDQMSAQTLAHMGDESPLFMYKY